MRLRHKTGSVTLTLSANTRSFDAAMRKLTEATLSVGDGMRSFRERYLASLPPVPHAFTPDFDLRCTVPRCDLPPEAHR